MQNQVNVCLNMCRWLPAVFLLALCSPKATAQQVLGSAISHSSLVPTIPVGAKVIANINTSLTPTANARPNPGAVAAYGNRAYVLSQNDNSVAIINTISDRVIGRIFVGEQPLAIAINSSGTRLYVANTEQGTISVVNTLQEKVIANLTAPSLYQPISLALNSSGNLLYVGGTNFEGVSGQVAVINTNTGASKAITQGNFETIALNPSGTRLYAAEFPNNAPSLLSVFNTANDQLIANINVGASPTGITFNSSGSTAYVSTQNSSIAVINTATNKVSSTIALPPDLNIAAPSLTISGITTSPNGQLVAALAQGTDSLYLVNTATNRLLSYYNFTSSYESSIAPSVSNYLGFINNSQLYISNFALGVQDVRLLYPAPPVIPNVVSTPIHAPKLAYVFVGPIRPTYILDSATANDIVPIKPSIIVPITKTTIVNPGNNIIQPSANTISGIEEVIVNTDEDL